MAWLRPMRETCVHHNCKKSARYSVIGATGNNMGNYCSAHAKEKLRYVKVQERVVVSSRGRSESDDE